jgi:predicted DNA-binding transcriptional regulator AlpA
MAKPTNRANDVSPRLLTQKAAAAYVGVSTPTFAKWVMEGIFPGPAERTKMWDRKAIDLALHKLSGIEATAEPVVDEWAIWEKQY